MTANPPDMIEIKSRAGRRLLTAGLLVVGLVITTWGVFVARDALESRDWPTVTGTIVSSEVRHVPAAPTADMRSAFRPEVVYSYAVDGQSYTGDRITFAELSSSERPLARVVVDRYPPGAEVLVAYDPEAPGRAVLEPSLRWVALLMPVFGAVLVISVIVSIVRPAWSSRED